MISRGLGKHDRIEALEMEGLSWIPQWAGNKVTRILLRGRVGVQRWSCEAGNRCRRECKAMIQEMQIAPGNSRSV